MSQKLQLKRGVKAALPPLAEGEPAFTTDEKKLYIGANGGNKAISMDGHTHTPAEADAAPANHSHSNYAPLASPTFSGTPTAPIGTDYATYRLRSMALVASAPTSAIGNGQLVGVYS